MTPTAPTTHGAPTTPGARATTLLLMGLRGSGKSTIGRLVAARAGVRFLDLDEATAALLGGGSVAEVWSRHGEGRFREAETRALQNLDLMGGSELRVVALGGGTPTAPGAPEILEAAARAGPALLIYLRARPDALRDRLGATDVATRPSLTGAGTLAEVEAVFAARDPLYRRLASLVLDTDACEPEALVARLASLLTA